jgi:hypothetical protein
MESSEREQTGKGDKQGKPGWTGNKKAMAIKGVNAIAFKSG